MRPPETSQNTGLHLLIDVPVLPPDVVLKLKARWIESAEEVLAIAATPGGMAGLMGLLGVETTCLEALLLPLREVVGEDRATAIGASASAGGPLGVRLTEEQKQRFGICDDQKGGVKP